MKRSVFLSALLMVACCASAQTISKSYTFDTPVVQASAGHQGYCSVVSSLEASTSVVGEPSLPSCYLNFYIPDGRDVEAVTVSKSGKTTYQLSLPLLPVQQPVPTSIDYVDPGFTEPLTAVYSSDAAYPSAMAEVVSEGWMHLVNKIVTVRLTPFEYHPQSGTLDFYSDVTVSLQLASSSSAAPELTAPSMRPGNAAMLAGLVQKVVENPEDVASVPMAKAPQCYKMPARSDGDNLGYEYVIVTSEALAPAFEPWVEWKRLKGLDAGIVTMEWIRANYAGDEISGIYDDAGKLRQFLYESYLDGTVYALLAGDPDVVPVRYAHSTSDELITELYFSDFNANWDENDNGKYGEFYKGEVDYEEEIYVGRVLCANATEANNWIEKALIYEKNPGLGDHSYLTRAFFTEADQFTSADSEGNVTYSAGEEIGRHLPSFKTIKVLREKYNGIVFPKSPEPPQHPTGPEAISEFNNNHGLVSFMGHGNHCSVAIATESYNKDKAIKERLYSYDNVRSTLCDDDPLGYSDGGSLANMNNPNHPNINYSMSCTNSAYEYKSDSTGKYSCFAKYATSGYRSGSVAFLGNTKEGYFGEVEPLFCSFCDALYSLETTSLGVVEAISKVGVVTGWDRIVHNLTGCPEMPMWIDTPKQINATLDRDEDARRLTVTLPSADYRLCITEIGGGDNPYRVVASDFTTMNFSGLPTDYTVVITRDGYLPLVYEARNHVKLQNITYNGADRTIKGYTIEAGRDVDPDRAEGDVVIKGNSNITLDAEHSTVIKGGFSVEKGSTLMIE